MSKLLLTSAAFENGKPVPRKYTGDGDDVSPPLAWSNVPAGTRQFALIVDDPDAPTPEPWVHWVLYQLAGSATSLPERIPPAARVAVCGGLLQGQNSWPRSTGYRGPAPPKGHGVHHYHFRLYALNTELDLKAGLDKAGLLAAIQGHVLSTAELIGTYER
jgi:Raf kinase inhibitor-like YbhB/YbcL family protein